MAIRKGLLFYKADRYGNAFYLNEVGTCLQGAYRQRHSLGSSAEAEQRTTIGADDAYGTANHTRQGYLQRF